MCRKRKAAQPDMILQFRKQNLDFLSLYSSFSLVS